MKAALLILIALLSSYAQSDIYKWTDSDGKVHFGDQKPSNTKAEALKIHVNSYTNVTYQLTPAPTAPSGYKAPKNIIMYSTQWCGYCKKARAYFAQNNIPYTDYDVEQSPEAKQNYDAIGGNGVPIIFVGQSRMNGFSAESFEYLYRQ